MKPELSRSHESNPKPVCCKHLRLGPRVFIEKYFWTAQIIAPKHQDALAALDEKTPLVDRLLLTHRRLLGSAIPALFFHFFWWAFMIYQNQWHLFRVKYGMSLAMVFGSIIAGMTSVGGGAVAFPVMTLVFNIVPSVSRDFVLMIQSCGMSAASFTIFFMQIQLDHVCLVTCGLGSVAGVVFGFHVVDPNLSPQVKKMGFVSIWFAYAFVLAALNFKRKRQTYFTIQNCNWWRVLLLIATGFVGGIFTSFSGSGVDICSFSVMTLVFRLTERVATPTSVILMAYNSLVGFCWRGIILQEIKTESFEYLAVCIPVVVIGAPVGSILGSHMHRQVLGALVLVINTAALIGAFVVVKPMTPVLAGASVGVGGLSICVFGLLSFLGQKLLLGTNELRQNARQSGDNLKNLSPPERSPCLSSSSENEDEGGTLKEMDCEVNEPTAEDSIFEQTNP